VLAPEIGEIIGGSQREERLEVLDPERGGVRHRHNLGFRGQPATRAPGIAFFRLSDRNAAFSRGEQDTPAQSTDQLFNAVRCPACAGRGLRRAPSERRMVTGPVAREGD
jgi:hypothetical protein